MVLKKMDTKRFKIALWKRYFETGYGISNYIKYVIALVGLSTLNLKATMLLAFIYLIFCFVLGYVWLRVGMYETEIEVGNQFNPFVKEMRKVYKV